MNYNQLYLLSLKFLNFRPRSEKEVRDYLQKKLRHSGKRSYSRINEGSWTSQDDTNDLVDTIIVKLKQQRFLNDEEFVRWLVRSRTEFKPKGKYIVKMELMQKGISQDIIEKVMNSDIRTQTEEALATEVLQLKKKKYVGMEPQERFRKAGAMLARRGFNLDTIKAAIDSCFGKMV